MSSPTLTEKALVSTFPKGSALSGISSGDMREQTDGLAVQIERDRIDGKNIVNDFFPDTTTFLAEWEEVFRLPTGKALTDDQRKARLKASWTKKSPATYTQMNEIYALSGFNVIARPLGATEDPRDIITGSEDVLHYLCTCGSMRCGQLTESSRCGAFEIIESDGEAIVFADGRPGEVALNYISVCGAMVCGQLQESSRCGNFQGSRVLPFNPDIPDDDTYWPMIYIIEGIFGGYADVPIELKEAISFLTYKIKPNFMWAIMKVNFTETI